MCGDVCVVHDVCGDVCVVHDMCVVMVYVRYVVMLQSFGKDDTVGCLIDLDNFTIAFTKNGECLCSDPVKHYSCHVVTYFMSTSFPFVPVLVCAIGKLLGKAFDIPHQLHGEAFFAAVTLKVSSSHHALHVAFFLTDLW